MERMDKHEMREIMARTEMTVEEVAESLGYSTSAVYRWLDGSRRAPILVGLVMRGWDKDEH